MRELDELELSVLLDFFAPGNGYVLDLTDESFNALTQRTVGVRLKEMYAEEGLSKGKSLRRYAGMPGNGENAYKLFTALMRYFELKIRGGDGYTEKMEVAYQKCKEILVACEPVNAQPSSPQNPDVDAEIEKMRRLYVEGSYFLNAGSEDKIRIGLEHLTSFLKGMIVAREWRVFGNPMYIRTVYELSTLGGDGIRPAETKMAESAWKGFSNTLMVLLRLTAKMPGCPFGATAFSCWLSKQHSITESVGSFDFWRGISTSVLSGLRDYSMDAAAKSHPAFVDNLSMMYDGIFLDGCDQYDFLPVGVNVPDVLPTTRFDMSGSGRGVVIDTQRVTSSVSDVDKKQIAQLAADMIRERPVESIVVGLNKTGASQVAMAAQIKRPERGFFSDPNLQVLFEVSVNTPGNWRTGRATPPEGFLDAFEHKDTKAMYACAEKYKASRAKSDAMDAKHVERGISEEQIYKQGGNRE